MEKITCLVAKARRVAEPMRIIQHVLCSMLLSNLALAMSYQELAKEYYALIDQAVQKERIASERSHQAMWNKKILVPATARGRVVNRQGQAVADAEVIVATESTQELLGQGRTDRDGRFLIKLNKRKYRGLSLTVNAGSYTRWAQTAFYGGITDYVVQLDREINQAFIDDLIRTDQPSRLWKLLEVVGKRQFALEIENIFSQLGELRTDLWQLIESMAFDRADDQWRDSSPVDRAKRFLVVWFAKDDEAKIKQWASDKEWFRYRRLAPLALSDETIAAVCWKWAKFHFEEQKITTPTYHTCNQPITDREASHALVQFSVRYAHWGYSEWLTIVKDNERWQLKLITEGERYHLKRAS